MEGWMAQLSDGRTAYEAPPIEGKPSSWQALLQDTRSSGINITRLTLVRGGMKILALSPKECDGFFQAYEAHMFWSKKRMNFQGVGSVVGDKVFITWVNLETFEIRQDVRPLDSCKIHTTIQ